MRIQGITLKTKNEILLIIKEEQKQENIDFKDIVISTSIFDDMVADFDTCQRCNDLYLHTRIGLCNDCLSCLNPAPPPDEIPTSPIGSSMFNSMKKYYRTLTTYDYMNVGGEDDSTHPVWSRNLDIPKFEKDPTIIPVNNRSYPIGKFLKKNNIHREN